MASALVLGDQLMRDSPALEGVRRVVFVEARGSLQRRPLHRRRAHAVLSGMRHFAAELREQGMEVVEHRGAASFAAALREERDLVAAAPTTLPARRMLEGLGVRLVDSNQFLTAPERFAAWADGRRRLVMEDFYREQRRRFGVLVDADGRPDGGRWNFDRENRRPPKEGLDAPAPWRPEETEIDAGVRRDLDALELWGDDGPRTVAVTPDEARQALDDFTDRRLAGFGPWQDAMVGGERLLFHSLLSTPLNLGVLDPLTAVRAAERAYRDGRAPPQSVEGFVRQILGWREYVWGMYWLRRDAWPHENALDAHHDLPAAYWGTTTGWNCLDTVVGQVREDGYAHHIERLMVLGNVLLLAGVDPWQAVRWFQGAFVDGAEWVMAPNAAGMALYADGGAMMTKPYAGGGNYINRMSTFCGGCRYRPNVRVGPEACPVTALYWDFMARHRERLAGNRRMRMPLRTLEKMDDERDAIRTRADAARDELRIARPPA